MWVYTRSKWEIKGIQDRWERLNIYFLLYIPPNVKRLKKKERAYTQEANIKGKEKINKEARKEG